MRRLRPSAPLVVALLALFVALGGPAQAAKLLDGGKIKAGTVGTKQIENRSLAVADLSRRAVRTLRATPAHSISARMLRENAVDARAIAPDSVLTGHVADNGLTAADLGANAVGADEIADGAVGAGEIRDGAVGAAEVADGGLSVRDLARQVGTLRWPIRDLAAGECDSALVPVSGIQVAGDFLLISPVSAWPTGLVYTVNGTGAETGFKVNVCNRGTARVDAAEYTFNYAVLGF